MNLLLLAYQVWKKPHLLLFCPAGSLTRALKTLPHIPRPKIPLLTLGFKPAFPLINFQTTLYFVGSDWCLHQIWLSSCVCTAGANGQLPSSAPPKNQKAEANNRYSCSFGGQGVSLHIVCRLCSHKEVWHRHFLWPLGEWLFSMIQNSVSYPACKGNGRLVLVAARSSWNWVLHKVLRYVQASGGIRSRRESPFKNLALKLEWFVCINTNTTILACVSLHFDFLLLCHSTEDLKAPCQRFPDLVNNLNKNT